MLDDSDIDAPPSRPSRSELSKVISGGLSPRTRAPPPSVRPKPVSFDMVLAARAEVSVLELEVVLGEFVD